jgi:hypothetical protein
MFVTAAQPGTELPLSALLETRASGAFLDLLRDVPVRLAGRRYARGLTVPAYWLPKQPAWVEYDLGDAGWTRLTGVLAVVGDRAAVPRANVGLICVVKGDGEELCKSAPFTAATAPYALDLDIAGVKTLRLELLTAAGGAPPYRTVHWADLRMRR